MSHKNLECKSLRVLTLLFCIYKLQETNKQLKFVQQINKLFFFFIWGLNIFTKHLIKIKDLNFI